MEDFAEAANGRQVLGRAFQDELELLLRFIEMSELDQDTTERDVGGEIAGVNRETGAAGGYGFRELAGAAVLFGELGESDRRRILLDPASQVFEP